MRELPSFQRLAAELVPRGLRAVLIHVRERRQTVIDAVRARGYTATVALDEDDEAVEAFQISGTPTVVLLNARGQVIGRAVGTPAWTAPAGRRLLNELLNP